MVSCLALLPVMKSRTDSEMSKPERGFFSPVDLEEKKMPSSEFRRVQTGK